MKIWYFVHFFKKYEWSYLKLKVQTIYNLEHRKCLGKKVLLQGLTQNWFLRLRDILYAFILEARRQKCRLRRVHVEQWDQGSTGWWKEATLLKLKNTSQEGVEFGWVQDHVKSCC